MTSPSPRIIALISQKGGVGKTTLAFNLVHYALEHAANATGPHAGRVLAIDLDSQGNLSLALTGDSKLLTAKGGSARLFPGTAGPAAPLDAITAITPQLHLLHGHQFLDEVDKNLTIEEIRATAPAVRALPYSTILVDTPPSVSLRHIAPLFWCHLVLMPLEADEFSISGLAALLKNIHLASRDNRELLALAAINRFKTRSSYQKRVVDDLEHLLVRSSSGIVRPVLADRVPVAEAIGQRKPVWRYGRSPKAVRTEWLSFCEAVYANL